MTIISGNKSFLMIKFMLNYYAKKHNYQNYPLYLEALKN